MDKPWLALNVDYGDNVIPALADQTIITWGIQKYDTEIQKRLNPDINIDNDWNYFIDSE